MTVTIPTMKAYIIHAGKEVECCLDCSKELEKRRMIHPIREGINFVVFQYTPPFTLEDCIAAARARHCNSCEEE